MRHLLRPIGVALGLAVATTPLLAASLRQPSEHRLSSTDPPPILVTGMVHLDPLPASGDSNAVLAAYARHRDGMLWYIGLAATTGLGLSGQMTGVYAEACVRQGHAPDFAGFMPGGPHHLGTHMHAHVKRSGAYAWRQIPQSAYTIPDSVRQVFADQVPWVNRVFEENGVASDENWFLHGSHASYPGMENDLWCQPEPSPLPYTNCFSMAGGPRGGFWVYRAGYNLDPDRTADTSYVKLPEVGGIIGYDAVHGPEGMVYGTVPYQKRDFMQVYIEWREGVRRGESSAVRYFNWMVHPYQLTDGTLGTDRRLVRSSIEELVDWLLESFIEHTDESGRVAARFANAREIRAAHESWRAAHPAEAAALQATLVAGGRPLYLPAIHDRLETTYYSVPVAGSDPDLVVHRFVDRTTHGPVHVAWSRSGTRPLEPALAGTLRVLHGDGSTEVLPSAAIVIGVEPVALESADASDTDSSRPRLGTWLGPVQPNPVQGSARLTFALVQASFVTLELHDVAGRRVATLLAGRRAAGTHAAILDATPLARGVYFARLAADGVVQSRKVLVVD